MILDVERSLLRARWVLRRVPDDAVRDMMRLHPVPEIVARLLCGRQVAADSAEAFLHPRLSRDFPDPFSMAGMRAAAADMARAVAAGRRVAVFGDFDVDGATSTAILVRFLRWCGLEVPFYIPDRMKEGYGPNIDALRLLKEQGAEIVILADCGITAFEVVEQAAALGLEIYILDHHEAGDALPPARHVVNPKRRDDSSGLSMLAACGVSFMFCVAVNGVLREEKFFERSGRAEAPLKRWLDLVALGTVCDMVPLTGVNRLFVRAGMELMAKKENCGIRALCDVAKVAGDPSAYHMGFVFGPRINAGSRVHQAALGARLLCTDDPEEARTIAFTLEDCNALRKEIQQEMFAQAVAMVEAKGLDSLPLILVGREDWHPGLSGLVAGQLKERYGKPSIVVAYARGESGMLEGRGSGRSVPGVNMGAAFIEAKRRGLLLKGGGHAMAAGFTILPDALDGFTAFIGAYVGEQVSGVDIRPETEIDALLTVRGASPDLAKTVSRHLGPFGVDSPEPVFAFSSVRLHMADVVGGSHVRCMIGDWEGGPRVKAMAFRAADTDLGRALLKHDPSCPIHIAGTLKFDTWNGREAAEVHILDAALQADR